MDTMYRLHESRFLIPGNGCLSVPLIVQKDNQQAVLTSTQMDRTARYRASPA
jgi:hypothetical protein